MNKWVFNIVLLCFLLFVGTSWSALLAQEDTLYETIVDTTTQASINTIAYWEDSAFTNFPKDTNYAYLNTTPTYKRLSKKYASPTFDYTDDKYKGSSFWDRVGKWFEDFMSSILPDWHPDFWKTMKVILYILGAGILLFIVYRLVFNKNKTFIHHGQDEESEEVAFVRKNLLNVDLNDYIQKYQAENNWREVIRYLQLEVLQLLALKGHIEWDYRKTNQEFVYEIKDRETKKMFQRTCTIYDYVWYGDFPITKDKFEEFRSDFIHLKNKLT